MISLNPPVENEKKITLQPTQSPAVVNPEELDNRVEAADYALEGEYPTDQIRMSFWLGYEDQLREQTVVRERIKERRLRQGYVQEVLEAAAADGRPLEVAERDYIMRVSGETLVHSPKTIFEHLYTRRLVNDILAAENNEVAEEAALEAPEEAEYTNDVTADFMTKQQIAMKIMNEVRARADATPFQDKAFAFAKGLIPFYTWFQQRDRIKQGGSFFLGQNIEDQARSLYFIPDIAEFESTFRNAVETIGKENILEALSFASAMVSYSGSDALWDNVFTGMDAVDIATLGTTAGVGAVVAARRWTRRARSITAASSVPGSTTNVARQVLQGNIGAAARQQALNRIQAATTTQSTTAPTPHQNLRALMASGHGILDPQAYTRNVGSLSNERAARLEEHVSRNNALLVSTMTDLSHVGRYSDEAALRGFQLAEAEFRLTYPNIEDAIIDIRSVRESEEVFAGVDHIDILIGKRDATGFSNAANAKFYAEKMYRLPAGSYDLYEEGGNVFIKMMKTVDETDPRLSDLRITTQNTTPKNFANVVLGWFRSATYLVSKEEAAWRHIATYGGTAVLKRLAAVADSLPKLGKNEAARLKTVLDTERIQIGAGGQPYRTVGEFEQAYQARHQVLPTDAELFAWSTYRQMLDFAHVMDNASVYRDKARLGIEQMSVGFSKQNEAGAWHFVNSDFFEGRFVQSLPTTQEDFTVGWVDPDTGKWKFGPYQVLASRNQHRDVLDLIDTGEYRVIQVADPRSSILREMIDHKGEPIEYIVVRNAKTKPLNPIQVEYAPDIAYHDVSGSFVKQARSHSTGFGRRVVDGDTVVQRTASNAEARQLAAAYDQGRQMVIAALSSPNANLQQLTQFVQANLPFANARAFIRSFRGTPYSAPDAMFDLDVPFLATASGQGTKGVRTYEAMFGTRQQIVDLDESSHNLSNRIAKNVATNKIGTQQRPVISVTAGQTIDPYSVLARSAERIARARFYDDYVHRSVEDWITEFGDTLNVAPEVLRANPGLYFFGDKPPFRTDYQDRAVLAAAKNKRRAVLSLLGQDTRETKAWKWMRQKVVDQVFRAHGQKASQIAEPWLMNSRTDPVAGVRWLVFQAKLGLFNVVQFPLQGSSIVHAAAIDGNPLRAVQAQFAYWGMRARGLSEVNPRVQGALTQRISQALGVSPQDLDEMYDAWRRSGMGIVSGEYGALDDYLNPKMFFGKNGGVARGLHFGEMFFREGNSWHRGTAFATAYLRWRQTNPGARLDNAALKTIVDRADLMYINMARDSNAAWQRGFPSIASTFFAYHARMAEQLLGFRLTAPEKLRLMMTYSAMWGVPIGVVGTSLGALWPFQESVQQAALEQGQDVDQTVLSKMFNEGLVDMLVEWAVGEDYNINERFGPQGLSWLRDIMEGDALAALQGAPGSFLEDFIASTDGLVGGILSIASGHGITLTADDFLDVARNISSVNNATKAWIVFNSGDWLTRTGSPHGGILKEGEAGDVMASMMAAMGVQPDEVSEGYLMIRSNRSEDQHRRAIDKEVELNFERWLKSLQQGEDELAKTFQKRAYILMHANDYTPLEIADALKRALRVNRELVESVAEEFVLNDPERRRDLIRENMEAE
jgi:hypothetical protein